MGKEALSGPTYYSSKGLKRLTIHVPKTVYRKLVKQAKKEDRSLQKSLRRLLIDHSNKL
jgi:predicted CopG family antitoxin